MEPSRGASPFLAENRFAQAVLTNNFCRGASPALAARIATHAQPRTYSAEEVIVEEGSPSSEVYLILKGSVRISRRSLGSDRQRVLGRLAEGQFFGELGLLDQQPRAARATAESPTTLAVLDGGVFLALLQEGDATLWHNLLRQTIYNLRQSNENFLADLVEEQKREQAQMIFTYLMEHQQDALTAMHLISESLRRDLAHTRLAPVTEELRDRVHQVVQIVGDLRDFVFPPSPRGTEQFTCAGWWQGLKPRMQSLTGRAQLVLRDYVEDIPIACDRDLLTRMTGYLFERVATLARTGTELEWRVGQGDDGIQFQLSYVHPELTEYTANHMCEPFLKCGEGKNTWINFSMVKQMAEAMGGLVAVHRHSGDRVTFGIELPCPTP